MLSVCFVGDRVAAGTLRGLVAIRSGWPGTPASQSESRAGQLRTRGRPGNRSDRKPPRGRRRRWQGVRLVLWRADTQRLFALKAAKDRTCAVEALALHSTSLVVARSALGATQVPLLSAWGLPATHHRRCS